MEGKLQNRVAIITGGSSGIGRAIALRFVREGARVVIADLQSNGVENEIGEENSKFIICDVAEERQVIHLFRETVRWAGRVDVLCNVAGLVIEATKYSLLARCHETEVEDFDRAIAINVRAVWLCTKYALKQMLDQEPLKPNLRGERIRGWIVNVASISGVVGCPNTPAYTTAKHAVVGLTKQIALDYAQDRIHCNAICPGFIKTPMTEFKLREEGGEEALGSLHPWNAMGTPEDCANAALFLASDDAAFVTGHTLMVDGGYVAR